MGDQQTASPLTYGAVQEAISDLPVAIRTVRRIRRMSLAQAGEEMGVAAATVRKVEEGGDYQTHTLLRILEWLNTQPEYAFTRSGYDA